MADAKFIDRLPKWMSSNLKSKSSWKLIIRCWIATWVAFLLILPHRSLVALGNAAFFGSIASILVPPFLPVQMFFFSMAIMILGCLFGWAWGIAAMRAALTARDNGILHAAIQKAQESAAGKANPQAVFTLQVFQGAFLDTRSSAVYGVFLGVGAFFFALVRAYNPKLALFSIFGTAFLDAICTSGPLFPTAQYWLLNSFFISTTSYAAIGCAAILLIFPETLNHQFLNVVSGVFANVRELIELQENVLGVVDSESIKAEPALGIEVRTKVDRMIDDIQTLDSQSGMLGLEFTFGRFNGNDSKEIADGLQTVVARIVGLTAFTKSLGEDVLVERKDADPSSNELFKSQRGDTYLLHQLRASHQQEEFERGLRPQDILPILQAATADLRASCIQSLLVAEKLLVHVNRRRWQRTPVEPEPALDDHIAELRRVREDFWQRRRLEVVEPFVGARPYRALFMALVFQANLLWCMDSIIGVLEVLSNLAAKRRRARLWGPQGLGMLWKVVRSRTVRDRQAVGEDQRIDLEFSKEENRSYRRDPDSSPPVYLYQHIGDTVYQAYKWCKTAEAIYAFKYVVASIVLWIPMVVRRTAYFAFVNQGFWALVTAQFSLEPYIADQLYSFATLFASTTLGLAIGLVAWYIGAAHGNGSAYGIAAVMAVLLLPLVIWRLFTPSPMPAVFCTATVILMVGYSWLDSHLEILGSPGVGWPVAWRRWLLVMIGAGVACILMLLPPKSARHAVRRGNAALVFEISTLYAKLISRWIAAEEETQASPRSSMIPREDDGKDGEGPKAPARHLHHSKRKLLGLDLPAWAAGFRHDIRDLWAKMQRLRVQTATATWEGNIRGAWPVTLYFELVDVETEILANLAQLAGALLNLHPDWRMRLDHRTKVVNPNFITDVMMVFSLVSQSLATGDPLYEVLPNNLVDRVFYHNTLMPADDPNELEHHSIEQLRSEEFMAYATGVFAVFRILTLLDKLHKITKRLCGEVPLRGFSEWRDAFEKRRLGVKVD